MKIFILLVISVFMLSACSLTAPFGKIIVDKIPILPSPKVLLVESPKIDKSKYPNAEWIKAPTPDLKNKKASWNFDDIEKISQSLTAWPIWGRSVEKAIQEYNIKVEGLNKGAGTSWWK